MRNLTDTLLGFVLEKNLVFNSVVVAIGPPFKVVRTGIRTYKDLHTLCMGLFEKNLFLLIHYKEDEKRVDVYGSWSDKVLQHVFQQIER